jgi:hypothetical protein
MGKRTTWRPRKFSSVEEIQPLIQLISSRSVSASVKKGLVRLPLRASRTAHMSLIARGWGERATCVKGHALAQDSTNGPPKD